MKKRRCKWTACWWSAVTIPGECSKKLDMTNLTCPMFRDEEQKIKEWRKRDGISHKSSCKAQNVKIRPVAQAPSNR